MSQYNEKIKTSKSIVTFSIAWSAALSTINQNNPSHHLTGIRFKRYTLMEEIKLHSSYFISQNYTIHE
jgi:hypothetical protein